MMEKNKIKKASAILCTIFLAASMLLIMTPQIIAQDDTPHGDEPENGSGISGPLPAGVTPEVYITTSAHLSYRPNPVGLNQIFLVNLWTSPALHASRYHPDYTVTITKPSGQEQVVTLDSYHADATAWFEWIADEVGEWTIRFDFLGTYFPEAQAPGGFMEPPTVTLPSTYYTPSTSGDWTLTVQEDVVYPWPEPGPPNGYWERPVQVEHRDWWPILGAWPGTGYVGVKDPTWDTIYPDTNPTYSAQRKFTPWVTAPNSCHIAWMHQEDLAGMIGGQAGSTGAMSSSPPFPSVIFDGRAYDSYTNPETLVQLWRCYDIRTGEVYWEKEMPLVAVPGFFFGTTYAPLQPDFVLYESPTQSEVEGAEAAGGWSVYLARIAGDRLYKFDPWDGNVVTNVSIAPLSSATFISNSYARNTDPIALSIQNIGNQTNPEYRLINWTLRGSSSNFASRVLSNTSYARSSLPSYIDWNVGLGADVGTITQAGAWTGQTITGFNAYTGVELWSIEVPDEPTYTPLASIADHGKIAILSGNGYYLAYDLATGNLAWKGDRMDYPWSSSAFGAYSAMSAYGMIYREAMDGVYAYSWDNGSIMWKYEAVARSMYESPYTARNEYTVYPFYSFGQGGIIADGKFFTWNFEHTESYPITRGWSLHAIDVFTGEAEWYILGCSRPGAIADGYLVASGRYDGYTYGFGPGKSITTVMAPLGNVAQGLPLTITGSVLDLSPAQPNTPCVSKDSMRTQMEYLHMQQPIDGLWHNETITGVPVALSAIGEDGSYIDIGTATTDGYSGKFGISWIPPSDGLYQIVASFEGDESYASSSDAAFVTVGPAASASTPIEPEQPTPEEPTPTEPTPEEPTPTEPTPEEPTPEEPEPTVPEHPLISAELAIVIAVVAACIIGAVAYIALRRRK